MSKLLYGYITETYYNFNLLKNILWKATNVAFFVDLWYNMYTLRGMVDMRKKKKDFDLELEEYIDEDYDENFYSVDKKNNDVYTEDEEEYNNFFKVDDDLSDTDEAYVEDYSNDYVEESYNSSKKHEDNSLYKFLNIFLVVFKWLGIAIAVVLIAYFITQGKIKSLLLYILGLIISFFFGYFFMYILNKFSEE